MSLEAVELAALAVPCAVIVAFWRANAKREPVDPDEEYGSRARHPSAGHVRIVGPANRPYDQDAEQ